MDEVRAAMVLCAGLGTRLRPLSEWRAKPMMPVGDRPAVQHVIERLAFVPARVVNVHHRADDVARWAEEQGVVVSRERELLGTAGGLAFASEPLGEGDVLVWNGDIHCDLDVRRLFEAHAQKTADATLVVHERERGQGNVGLDRDGRIVRLRGERFGDEARGADFLGIHVVGRRTRAALPARGCLVGDVYIPALARGAHLAAYLTDAPFVDIGTVPAYLEANRAWLRRTGRDAWAAADVVPNASIEGSVVGARARIDAPALRCVVWPKSVVREAISDAVVTPFGVVRP